MNYFATYRLLSNDDTPCAVNGYDTSNWIIWSFGAGSQSEISDNDMNRGKTYFVYPIASITIARKLL